VPDPAARAAALRAEGKSAKEIAATLGITTYAVWKSTHPDGRTKKPQPQDAGAKAAKAQADELSKQAAKARKRSAK
jgi:transposase-like protein